MIIDITYPAKCKDCVNIRRERLFRKDGTLSNKKRSFCNLNNTIISMQDHACDKFKLSEE